MRGIHAATLAVVASVLAGGLATAAPLRALLIEGDSTLPGAPPSGAFKTILETGGLFQVDVVSAPGKGGNSGLFQPQFERYKVVVLDYGGEGCPINTMAALDKF